MEQKVLGWSNTTKSIYTAVLLYSAAFVLSVIFGLIADSVSVVSMASSMVNAAATGDIEGLLNGGGGTNIYEIITWICLAGVAVGYFLFMRGVGELAKYTYKEDEASLKQVRLGAILIIVGAVVDILPFMPGIIVSILYILGFVMMLIGYSKLKNSKTLSPEARKGMSQLFIATLLLLIAAGVNLILGWIPVVIHIITGIVSLVGYIMVILGWKKVKESNAPVF